VVLHVTKEEVVVQGATGDKNHGCRGVRELTEKKKRLVMVVMVSAAGEELGWWKRLSYPQSQWCCGGSGRRNDGEREREREREKWQKTGGRGWFFVNFGPDFIPAQATKSTPIYRG